MVGLQDSQDRVLNGGAQVGDCGLSLCQPRLGLDGAWVIDMGFQVGTVDELTSEAATIEILLEQAEALADEVAEGLGIDEDDESEEEEPEPAASPFAPGLMAALGQLGDRLQGIY